MADMASELKTTCSRSWKLFGVEFAPLIIPVERRLQTLAVFTWIWMILFLGVTGWIAVLYMLFFTKYWWISVAYLTWMIADRKAPVQGGRKGKIRSFFRNAQMWKHYCNYFPIRLIKTCDLDPKKNYIFGSHPHGLLSSGLNVHVHTLAVNFMFPINREWVLGLGGVNASKESITYLMSKKDGGNVSVLVVGGAAESMYASDTEIALVLKKRKGFIKMALKNGAQLVPTFSFGEAHVYNILPTPVGSWIRSAQEYFRHVVGIAPVIFFGRGMFQYNIGMIPHRKPIHVVVGKPIEVEKSENPTVEEIEKLHTEYMEALISLYNEYNPKYGDTNLKLTFI